MLLCLSKVNSFVNGIEFVSVGGMDPVTGQPLTYPQTKVAVAEAEGRYIRFFEQGLEWDQTLYTFYPYFSGRKKNWIDRVLIEDQDPCFADFLKAGAARVVVPVRPGFEKAITHFPESGVLGRR